MMCSSIIFGDVMLSRGYFLHFPFSEQSFNRLLYYFYPSGFSPRESIFSQVISPDPEVLLFDDDIVSFLIALDSGSDEELVGIAHRIGSDRFSKVAAADFRDVIHSRVCQLFILFDQDTYCRLSAIFSRGDIFVFLQDLFLDDQWTGFVAIYLFRCVISKFSTTSSTRINYELITKLKTKLVNLHCIFPPFVETGAKNTEWEHILDAYRDTDLFSDSYKKRLLFLKYLDQESYFSYCLRLTNVLPSFSRLLLILQAIVSMTSSLDYVTEEQEHYLKKNLISHYGNMDMPLLVTVFQYLLENNMDELKWVKEGERNVLLVTILKTIRRNAEHYVLHTADAVCNKLSQLLSATDCRRFEGGLALSKEQWIPHTDREVDLAAASALLSDSVDAVDEFLQNYSNGGVHYRLLINRLGQKLRHSSVWMNLSSVNFLVQAIEDNGVSYPLVLRVGSLWLMIFRVVDYKSRKVLKTKVGGKLSKKLQHHSDHYVLYDFRHGASYTCGKSRQLVELIWMLLGVQIWLPSSDIETLNDSLRPSKAGHCNVGPFKITRFWDEKSSEMQWLVERENWPPKIFIDPISLRRWLRVECGIYQDGAILQEVLYSSVDRGNLACVRIALAIPCSDKSARDFLLNGHKSNSDQEMLVWDAMNNMPIVSTLGPLHENKCSFPDSLSIAHTIIDWDNSSLGNADARFFAFAGLIVLCCRSRGSYWWQNGLFLIRTAFYRGVGVDFVINAVSLLPRIIGFDSVALWTYSESHLSLVAGLCQLYNLPLSVCDLKKWRSFLEISTKDSTFRKYYEEGGVCPTKLLEPHTLHQ